MGDIRIAILSARDEPRAFMDNGAPDALHYYNDELHEYVEGNAYTYFFSTSAKHDDSKYLVEGNKIAFVYRDKPYYLNIMKVVKDEYTIDVEAYGLSLELLNEQTGEYSAASAMSFEQYIDAFDFADILTIGVNEVSDKKIKNEWTGTSTILARLFSLANVFGAEIEFVTELNDDYSLARLVLNVYQAYDEEAGTQGIGEDRRDITLRYGVNVEGITKTSDITELYTAIRPTGKDGLTITSLNKTEYDADGNLAYKSPSGNVNIYAVQACEQFPSNLLHTTSDRYTCMIWSYDTDDVNVLYGQALAQLKANSVPKVTYEIKGFFDTGVGDTVRIADEAYNPPLYLEARVTEQVRSFTDPGRNKTTFSNVVEKESEIDPDLLARMEALKSEFEAANQDIIIQIESTASGLQNDIENINEQIIIVNDTLGNNYTELSNRIDRAELTTSELYQASIDYTNQTVEDYKLQVANYIDFSPEMGLVLGSLAEDGSESGLFKTVIDSRSLKFMQEDEIVSYITNNQMYISSAIIEKELRIGDFILSEKSDGSVAVTWLGG